MAVVGRGLQYLAHVYAPETFVEKVTVFHAATKYVVEYLKQQSVAGLCSRSAEAIQGPVKSVYQVDADGLKKKEERARLPVAAGISCLLRRLSSIHEVGSASIFGKNRAPYLRAFAQHVKSSHQSFHDDP